MQEVWKDIEDFVGCYQISNLGVVRRLDTIIPFCGTLSTRKGRTLKSTRNSKGYDTIVLCWKSKRKTYTIHRLVAEVFIPKIPGKDQVNHIDGNPRNNAENNLEWVTPSENQVHAYNLGLKPKGSNSGASKLNEQQVLEIKKSLLEGASRKELASRYNVTHSTIKWIDLGRTWRSVILHNG
jgi:hypothetical protein